MCGRYATSRTPDQLTHAFAAELGTGADVIEADYNVAPTKSPPLVIGRAATSGVTRELITARWGLVPAWAKDPSIGNRLINARSETVTEKPSFRRAFASRRALVPVDGFYEWYSTVAGAKQPFYMSDRESGVLALAGLYEFWRASADDAWLISFTILTTSAEGEDGRIHDRAPLLVGPDAWDTWLAPQEHGREELLGLLVPATPGRLAAWPVSTEVNNVRNNGPQLVEPIPAE